MLILFSGFVILLFNSYWTYNDLNSFSQIASEQSISNKTKDWISERDNLNITMSLEPTVPIIDKNTKIIFKVKKINDTKQIEELKAKVTMTDHDGRLYKFENKSIPVINGQFLVDYVFPDDGEHRIILQIYKNDTPFAVTSFDILIPHAAPQSTQDKLLGPLSNLFDFFQ
ncbi:hypothetical protein [Candidatus Nitrosocosmicus sp. SS]|jgi:hypothetical protein|uniref:hypothetical protein n=1 Tax=Candidatus Nitrosocosmicus agrestis TaxID=2563600 RepID=UPI00122DF16C|nr:hypothetical protein [Candidatus Nitrosocosmicus sp. SS]KAA2283560.1 hypothetical protein F1Z66_01395 [Candidatus Nitrosocosmicus sp. SS]KAF0869641.1 hypothetical protein E5N71_03925 [Candidatus Nitrosocosmicus sp. SS]